MLRSLRATRSLPSLKSAAAAQHCLPPPVPALPFESCRSMATATTRARKNSTITQMEVPSPPMTMMEPKKRGRPRKSTAAPILHRRSNSTDAKSSRKSDPVATIPQPGSTNTSKTSTLSSKKRDGQETRHVPLAAEKFRATPSAPPASDAKAAISTANPEDLGTRVQAVSSKAAAEAQAFANEAVSALESAGHPINHVQDLLKRTMAHAAEGATGNQGSSNKEGADEGMPSGEKTVLLSMLGLTGLWVAFGGRFQKKSKKG